MGRNAQNPDFEDSIIPLLEDLMQFALSLTGTGKAAAKLLSESLAEASQTWDELGPVESCLIWLHEIITRRYYKDFKNTQSILSFVHDNKEEGFIEEEIIVTMTTLSPQINTVDSSDNYKDISHFKDIYSFPEICRPGMILAFLESRSLKRDAILTNSQPVAVNLKSSLGRRFIREELYAYLMGKDESDLFANGKRG